MKREIKFRAWNTKTEVMYADTGITSLGVNNAVRMAAENDYILMQFTGIKDENGWEIYEGDVVRGSWSDDLQPQAVIYQAPEFVLKTKTKSGKWSKFWSRFLLAPSENQPLIVIGNIYETPELLEAI